MQKSESITELAKALVRAQTEIGVAQMNSVNPFLKNRYADLGSVIEAVKPALAKNGLAFVQPASMSDGVVAVETVLLHESGEYISETLSLPAGEERGKSLAQVTGSIVTYLRRYGLSAMLGVYADEDADVARPAASAQRAQPPPAQPDEPPDLWEAESETPAQPVSLDGPIPAELVGKSWHEFRDCAARLLDHYNSGGHVFNTLKGEFGNDYHPWVSWDDVEAAKCWDALVAHAERADGDNGAA